jgi:hypothetical protein
MFGEDDIILSYDTVNKREADSSAMLNAREGLESVVASRKRREAMRPLAEEVDKDFAHLLKRKRVTAIRKALRKREDFTRLLPKNLKDSRFIDSDIDSILCPPESFNDQLEDAEPEEGEPLANLFRDLGLDPDEAI